MTNARIIPFPIGRAVARKAKRAAQTGQAEIVIFPGVRRERLLPVPAPSKFELRRSARPPST